MRRALRHRDGHDREHGQRGREGLAEDDQQRPDLGEPQLRTERLEVGRRRTQHDRGCGADGRAQRARYEDHRTDLDRGRRTAERRDDHEPGQLTEQHEARRCHEMTDQELPPLEWIGGGQQRVVGLLREPLRGVEAGEEQCDPRDEDERRRAVPHRRERRARDQAERELAHEPVAGPSSDALPVAGPAGEESRGSHAATFMVDADPGLPPWELQRELAVQHDDGPDVLQGRREPELPDQAGAPFGRLDRRTTDPAERGRRDQDDDTDRADGAGDGRGVWT